MKLDFNYMLKDFVGERGLNGDDILNFDYKPAAEALEKKRPRLEWRDLPYTQNEVVEDILNYVKEVKDDFEAFVVLGIGGSALGPSAVQQAINSPYYNELPREKRGGYPKFYVCDNADPERLFYLFENVPAEKCLFNVITKSGSTSETMSQFMYIKKILQDKLGDGYSKNIVATTDAKNGNLIKIARAENFKTFIIPPGVGGRFSELSPVGLLPAAFAGIDIKRLLAGAARADEAARKPDCAAHKFALLNYLAYKKDAPIVVLMPYADSLKYISDWFAQLWAESLGKKFDNDGKIVNVGQTPVKALGVTDQHSQVQLFTEGPFDKIVVIIGVDKFKATIQIPKTYSDIPSLAFLGGATQNKLIQTEQMATEYALLSSGKMNMTITLPEVNEETLGELLYFFEAATAYAGELFNINAFDQPGVEEGKNATYAMFNRPGYEDKRKELENRPRKVDRFIV